MESEESCSDCKIELIQRKWTQLLLNWINKCITPKTEVSALNPRSLVEVINKYKHDICYNDMDRAMLCTDDLEPFLRYKYPILRLRYFYEDADVPRKLYIMTSVLLFHCCVSSQMGVVVADICKKLEQDEQEMVLRFCEKLSEMETTLNNVDSAIRAACESVSKSIKKSTLKRFKAKNLINTESYVIPSDCTITATSSEIIAAKKVPTLKFKSSVTVMPSCITDTSSYSKTSLQAESSNSSDMMSGSMKIDDNMQGEMSDSNEITIYNVESAPLIEGGGDKMEKVRKIQEEDSDLTKSLYNLLKDLGLSRAAVSSILERVSKAALVGSYHIWLGRGGNSGSGGPQCKPDCACTRCSVTGTCCGVPGSTVDCDNPNCSSDERFEEGKPTQEPEIFFLSKKTYILGIGMILLLIIIIVVGIFTFMKDKNHATGKSDKIGEKLQETNRLIDVNPYSPIWTWRCRNHVCQKIYHNNSNETIYTSLTRCTLICMGPQIWPLPIGYTFYSKTLVALATNKLEYKLQSIPSDIVHQYLAEAFKLFIGDLARLERIDLKTDKYRTQDDDIKVKKMNIQIDVETDPDPRLRLNTDESYSIKIETFDIVKIGLNAASFCGIRHGLETLSQMILVDQITGNLITVSTAVIKDAPSYKYRGLMIDTGRNYIPVSDLLRTIDAMATCKLNTFHWRISDSTSFPLLLPKLGNLFEFGAYDRSMIYTTDDVRTIVNRAGVRGIRVLIEVAIPGPVGRSWSWSSDATCPKKNDKKTCDNILCSRLKMQDSVFDVLQYIYTAIIDMTGVDDIFHLSDSIFSLTNCYYLIEEREGFLEKAIERLRLANKGFLPKLPVVWYTPHLEKDYEAKTWERFGVQVYEWKPHRSDQVLSKYKVIHSSKWDLSCELKKQRCTKYRTWQEMYSWKSWQTMEVFSIEGGEAILWTDLVDTTNLEYHLWPRAAAVAERLWSDIVANNTPKGLDYIRLDSHRWRLQFRGIKVQPIWPFWCSFNPGPCLAKLKR